MDEIRNLCVQLQELRKGDGVSLDVLSEKSDIDKSTLSKYERGVLCPKFDTLKKWANVLGHRVSIEVNPVYETVEG
jgi:transcriptional regulator with XRE-family HTH domain